MDMQKLRGLLQNSPKFPGTVSRKPASVCNVGFPGTFNLSFTEAESLEEYHGQYLEYDHDFIYSKIQPCVRHQDWRTIVRDAESRYRYLGVFDMADVGGAISLVDGQRLEEAVHFSMTALYNFFISTLGLEAKRLRIKYCQGGQVSAITRGKYSLQERLGPDPYVHLWQDLGLDPRQFITDATRDAFLALHIYGLPTPWGYRNEIFYERDGKLIDIATFEYLSFRPVSNAHGEVISIAPWEHCFVISAVGVDRILMILEGQESVRACSHITPLVKAVAIASINSNAIAAEVCADALRTIHRIVADAGPYANLSRHRRQKIRDFYRSFLDCLNELGIPLSGSIVQDWLRVNANIQPYYPELEQAVRTTTSEILAADQRFHEGTSVKAGGVVQR